MTASQPPPHRVPEEKAELHPCDYCGTIPAVNAPTLHSASQCRENVYMALRCTRRELDASRSENAFLVEGLFNAQAALDAERAAIAEMRRALEAAAGRLDQYVGMCQCPGKSCVEACDECDKTQGMINGYRAALRAADGGEKT